MSDGNGYDAQGEVEAIRRSLADLEGHQARRDQAVAQVFGIVADTRDRVALIAMRTSTTELAVKTLDSKVDRLLEIAAELLERAK